MSTSTQYHRVDAHIARRVGAAAAAGALPLGRSAIRAHAWQESLYSRAQIRAERHLRSTR
ncbi:amidohydrolase [Mycobacterium sp. CBMA293]|uniref:Uncharacterized protein n=1 Tax=Mycolicibacterium sp. CBMA 213 TaxID=1968788 RepID=A0A1S6GKY5_9MYCO|nr:MULTISPECIES: amidohydrolase [unclassified Mycolicibacterium]AQS22503.1 hypothetical protein pCBMA213_2_00139 [Mycolicibacterium sp. CBMA 213]MUL48403.1 amidohydrolase [Mycolicibacterium sp. CBMA 360]MUL62415.1 amidohydrolase [Mycolicibacterium sp. CBMA 335]MUM04552.1 hypothetical protein [Mycolicibacterium sp. CBMA 213]MUM14815.1 amidohydrolase [Mycolicibacterium sp. CBMA 293]